MQGVNERIKDLQDMITNAEELLEDEMARIMLGDDGIEAIEYMIKHYQDKIQELQIVDKRNESALKIIEIIEKGKIELDNHKLENKEYIKSLILDDCLKLLN
ncbi:MAG: hypothetical protein N4A63_00370 [Vallitalea sp.]|jgi:N-methylhydantoinase B/oxoprolinase/acetone carboxylase alpha subunit|nr:hypothetical protein [Vallitalea sp.]